MAKPSGLAAFTKGRAQPQAIETVDLAGKTESVPLTPLRKRRGSGEVVALTVKLPRTEWQRLRQLADAEGTTIQAIAEAGFSAVLREHGLPPIKGREV